MPSANPLGTFELIARQIFPQGKLLQSSPLPGGISASMTLLEVALPDGQNRRIVLRQPGEVGFASDPAAIEREFSLLQFAHTRGLSVPAPLLLDTSHRLLPTPYFLMELIEGKLDFSPADPKTYIYEMVIHLVRIHQLDISEQEPLPSIMPSGRFSDFYGDSLFSADPAFQESRVRRALESAWPISGYNRSALLHGDYWPGNLLWHSGKLVAVIDWEDAGVGDPLLDLAGARMETNWIFGQDFCSQFTAQYLAMNPLDTAMLPFWDLLAALRMLRWAAPDLAAAAAFFHPYGRSDITELSIKQNMGSFIANALKKLE